MRFTLGTHNLHDEAGQPTRFADLILFTEAIPHTVDDALSRPTPSQRARALVARTKLRATGYAVVVVRHQPDLIIAWRRRVFRRMGPLSYERVVDGVPHVTPNRGTAWLPLQHRATGRRIAAVWEHRINAAFPPFVRGEPKFRADMWRAHTAHSTNLVETLHAAGWLVVAGGDENTPEHIHAYPTMREVGHSFDRLALRGPRAHIGQPFYLSRKGSDHPRLRASVDIVENR